MRLITNNPMELAHRRVRRGVEWLRENAPLEWERRMWDIRGGRAYLRFNLAYGNEDILALAFCTDPRFASSMDGYVSFARVADAFKLNDKKLHTLGFDDRRLYRDGNQWVENVLVSAWREALTTYASPPHVPPRHRTLPVEHTVAHERNGPKTGFWGGLLEELRLILKQESV